MATATTLSDPVRNTSAPLSLRVAVIAFVTPIVLMLGGMAFWPELADAPALILLSNESLVRDTVFQFFLMATLGTWLWRRGWRPHRTATVPFVLRDLGRGIGVWLAAFVGAMLWTALWRVVAPDIAAVADAIEFAGRPTFWVAVMANLVNSIFEEVLWLGLGVAALHAAGVRVGVAATISVALRVLVHAYQGPLALMFVLPWGMIITIYYVRTRRLWPVIVAHTCQNMLAFTLMIL